MNTRFIFFDLGNVLLRFNTYQLIRQAAAVTGCNEKDVQQAIYASGLQRKFECGEITEQEFYDAYCKQVGSRPDLEALLRAFNDIFLVLEEMHPFVRGLAEIDFPRGILSNVGPSHWKHCTETYPFLLQYFPNNHVLSYRVGAMKPDRKIYEAAYKTARDVVSDIKAEEILFIDDIEQNVSGAQAFGLDAVQFVSISQLVPEIELRGLDRFVFRAYYRSADKF